MMNPYEYGDPYRQEEPETEEEYNEMIARNAEALKNWNYPEEASK